MEIIQVMEIRFFYDDETCLLHPMANEIMVLAGSGNYLKFCQLYSAVLLSKTLMVLILTLVLDKDLFMSII